MGRLIGQSGRIICGRGQMGSEVKSDEDTDNKGQVWFVNHKFDHLVDEEAERHSDANIKNVCWFPCVRFSLSLSPPPSLFLLKQNVIQLKFMEVDCSHVSLSMIVPLLEYLLSKPFHEFTWYFRRKILWKFFSMLNLIDYVVYGLLIYNLNKIVESNGFSWKQIFFTVISIMQICGISKYF